MNALVDAAGVNGSPERENAISFGLFDLYVGERLLEKQGKQVRLGSRSLDILITLVNRAGEVVSNNELMEAVWPATTVDDSGLRVHLASLRKVLDDGKEGARYITNVPGRGYCFVAPISRLTNLDSFDTLSSDKGRRLKLPPLLTNLVGRDSVISLIESQLLQNRFVSIVGAGGIGKTSVAIAIGQSIAQKTETGVVFVDFASILDPRLSSTLLASTLGLTIQAADPTPSLLAWLRDRAIVLILDNCEHVIEAVTVLVEQVLVTAPKAFVLVTSRESLRAEGEYVHRLEPLACPIMGERLIAADAMSYPAVQLFVERAAARGSTFSLQDDDAIVVSEICNRLDGLPLAIELAAGRVHAHGLHGTANLLENRFRLEWLGRRTALARHQTLSALLDWSYNLLPPVEQAFLRRLCIFVGPFSLAEAAAICSDQNADAADVANLLESLVEKSLASAARTDKESRYRLLETTRTYMLQKLVASGEARATAIRHAEFYAARLRHFSLSRSATSAQDSGRLDCLSNVRAALTWAFKNTDGDVRLGVGLSAVAVPHFLQLSLLSECLHWSELALDFLPVEERGTSIEIELQEGVAISSMFAKGNHPEVQSAITRALDLAEADNDNRRRLNMLAGLNIYHTRVGQFREALLIGDRCISLATDLGDPAALIMAEWMVGVAHHLVGDQKAAQNHCEAGFALAARHPNVSTDYFGYDHRVRARVALARALWLRGFPDQAMKAADQAINEAARREQPITTCISLIYSVPVYLWCGEHSKAAALIDQLIEHAHSHSLTPYHAVGIGLKGQHLILEGHLQCGLPYLERALTIMQGERHNIQSSTFLICKAEALLQLQKPAEALTILEEVLMLGGANGDMFDLPEVLRLKAVILEAGDFPGYQGVDEILLAAVEKAKQQSALSWELRATREIVKKLVTAERVAEAKEILQSIYGKFGEGFSTSDLVQAKDELSRLSAIELN